MSFEPFPKKSENIVGNPCSTREKSQKYQFQKNGDDISRGREKV
jgi:hypothetical protein